MFDQLQTIDSLVLILVDFFNQFGFLASFISVFALGETAIITLLTTYQNSSVSLPTIVFACILATFLADVFWFAIGRYYPSNRVPLFIRKKLIVPINSFFKKPTNGRIFLILIILKFLIGFRIVLMLYLSKQRISWAHLITYDIIGTVLYIAILTTVCVYINSFYETALPSLKTFSSLITALVVIIILSKVASYKLRDKK